LLLIFVADRAALQTNSKFLIVPDSLINLHDLYYYKLISAQCFIPMLRI